MRRAQWIRLEWNEQTEISIINIYMPNNRKEAVQMIEELTNIVKQKKIKNTIIMGDFNQPHRRHRGQEWCPPSNMVTECV